VSSYVLADLIISLVLICLGIGAVIHGKKLRALQSVKSGFASPNTFIILGTLMIALQVMDLADTYL
jgi:hypothetical protein